MIFKIGIIIALSGQMGLLLGLILIFYKTNDGYLDILFKIFPLVTFFGLLLIIISLFIN